MSSETVYRNPIDLHLTQLLDSKSTFEFKFKVTVGVGLLNSVLSNPSMRIIFRTGELDARKLENQFRHFEADDLTNLKTGCAICKVDTPTDDFSLVVQRILSVDNSILERNREKCLLLSRNQYSQKKSEVEDSIRDFYFSTVADTSNKPEKQTLKTENVKQVDNQEAVIPETIDLTDLEQSKKDYITAIEKRQRISEHREIQNFVKKTAESLGFRAVIEESINNGMGRVDVGLTRDTLRIVVEISVTNSSVYEVDNISKCLDAGYGFVLMCCENISHLRRIEEKVVLQINQSQFSRLRFLASKDIATFLNQLNLDRKPEKENVVKGYRIKIKYK